MKDAIEKLQNKMDTIPFGFVSQTHTNIYPIFHSNISKLVDCESIANFCLQEYVSYTTIEHKKGLNERLDYVVKGWHSHAKKPKDIKELTNFFNVVEAKLNVFDPEYTYFVKSFWINLYQKNDSAVLHNHKKTDFACVFYPLVDEKSSPLCVKHENDFIDIPIKTGSLVAFSGDVYHMVREHVSDTKRISIAMNAFKKMIAQISKPDYE